MKKDERKIGLREIAYNAHVSVATVSRVLNGNHRVDPTIQKTVLDAAAKLNAHISQRIKNKALVFLLSNRKMLHAFDSRVLVGAEGHCAKHGWDIVFLAFNYSPNVPWKELHLPAVVRRRQSISGVILAGKNYANLLELLTHNGLPSVVLGNNTLETSQNVIGNDVVFSDEIGGARDMTRYLIGMGHRHIWFVGNTHFPWCSRCFDGYTHAMEEAGLVPCRSSIESEDDIEAGYLGTKSLLARGTPVSAIFAGTDTTAHGVYKALGDSGVKIPDDISVAGCDDTVGKMLYPQLTTVQQFPEQLGKQMAQLVLARIGSPSQDPQRVTIPTALVKRDSCGRIELPVDKAAIRI